MICLCQQENSLQDITYMQYGELLVIRPQEYVRFVSEFTYTLFLSRSLLFLLYLVCRQA